MTAAGKFRRNKERVFKRWFAADYIGGTERFQIKLLTRDVGVFLLLPLSAIIVFKLFEAVISPSAKKQITVFDVPSSASDKSSSQIIRFGSSGSGGGVAAIRSAGTLVRLRLLNRVETLEGASVHAQIVDGGLGGRFLGATMIGDVTADTSTARINFAFHFVRDLKRLNRSTPISARAMSLDGTAGVEAIKKEGFFARAVLRSGSSSVGGKVSSNTPQDFKTLVAQAVAAGMVDEFRDQAAVESKKAQVLTIEPGTEFFAELTDEFPSTSR